MSNDKEKKTKSAKKADTGNAERQKLLLSITKKLFVFTAAALSVIGLFFYLGFDSGGGGRTFLVLIVFASGLMGGFVSLQQRLPKVKQEELYELSQSWTSILLIPINGGIFAILLHILFLSDILKGTLFPQYSIPPFDPQSPTARVFSNFLLNTIPSSGADVAKLMFWSFVSGFSERFVPQIIKATTKEAESNGKDDTGGGGQDEDVQK